MIDSNSSKCVFIDDGERIVMDEKRIPTIKCETDNCGGRVRLCKSFSGFLYSGLCPNCSCLYGTTMNNVEL